MSMYTICECKLTWLIDLRIIWSSDCVLWSSDKLCVSSGGEKPTGWWISRWIAQRLKTDGSTSKLFSPITASWISIVSQMKTGWIIFSYFKSFHIVTMPQHLDGRLTLRNRLAPARELMSSRLIPVPRTTWPVAVTSTDSVSAAVAVRSMPFNRWLRFFPLLLPRQ